MQLPQRKRVKLEQEPEEVSTVTSGKVVVSSLGSARIIGRSHQPLPREKTDRKLLAKTRTDRVTKKDSIVSKKKSSSVKRDSVKIDAKRGKSSADKASKSVKRSAIQQPPRKKKRSV